MVKLINLPKFLDDRGNLSYIEEQKHIPFNILRIYWIYDVPGGEFRGSHAFKESEEFIVALSGSFDITIHDGKKEATYSLNRSYYGLYIPRLTYRKLENFSTNALAIILSSRFYDDNDYIRDFNDFLKRIEHETYNSL